MNQAVILAGGLGTRLRAVLGDLPKPMAPVGGKPFLEYQLLALKRYEISKFVICAGYRAQMICDYFGDGAKWGIQIGYSIEATPLGTAGALKHAEPLLEDEFLVLNGDTFVEFDYTRLLHIHREKGARATLVVTPLDDQDASGNVALDPNHRVACFGEDKTGRDTAGQRWVNAGVYVMQRSLLSVIPQDRPISLEKETFPLLLAQGEPINAFIVTGYFVDIGTPANYSRFERDIEQGRAHVDSQ